MTKGELIAGLVALSFKGRIGPSGGEDPILRGNEVILYSQCPECGYRFNDDGSIDCFFPNPEQMKNSLIYDCGLYEDEAQEEIDHPSHYNNFKELLNSNDGWFMDWVDVLPTRPAILNAINVITAIKETD